jgi:PIN domain nuclease of toxin-antitoxin system
MIVIDTHVWIWWVDDSPLLKRSIRDRIDAEDQVCVCSISMLEIATAVSLGRLVLRPSALHWLRVAQSAAQVKVHPLTAEVCLESTNLPGEFHRDPADRLIVALARLLNSELLTADRKILAYDGVQATAAS